MKITLATIKSFIRKNAGNMYIDCRSAFEGMTDCVESCDNRGFKPAIVDTDHPKQSLGIVGAWFVRSSRDYFTEYSENGFKGFQIDNCCGSFVLAVKE